jgi:hypothetical protein
LTTQYIVGINNHIPRCRGGGPMAYIVCDKRRGNPKINLEVCRRKCESIQECKAYKRYVESNELEASVDVESHTTVPSHEGGVEEEVQAA